MENITKFTGRLLVSAAILLAACSSYSNPTGPAPKPTITPSTIAGNWVVSSLIQRTEDKSSDFSGFTFTFAAGGGESGTVTAVHNGPTVSGTWVHSPASASYYCGTSTAETMSLNLGSSTPLDRLTGTWNVESSTGANLTLVNPEAQEPQQLVFAQQ